MKITLFLSEKSNEWDNRLCLTIQERKAPEDKKRFDKKIVAINDKILEYKCITACQHKKN